MQNYSNHIRFNPFHHFVIIPSAGFLIAWTILKVISTEINFNEKVFYIISSALILFITLITRVYALKNQDRLIRLEMRLRYFQLTGNTFTALEEKLKLSQIIALRFASDEELLALIDKTLKENLSNKEIKKAIQNWQTDLMRV